MILRRFRFVLRAVWVLLVVGCYDNAGEPSVGPPSVPPATTTLAELRRLYAGSPFRVEGDVVVRGRVTSSDEAGNFYRTLMLEEEGAAVELLAGIDGLHNIYPPGCEVTLSLRGLALGERYGVLQVGRLPEAGSSYETDYIGSRAALDNHLFRGECSGPPAPAVLTLGELTPSMAGRLVRIDGLRYLPDSLEEGTWSGYRRFVDDEGGSIRTYTRSYASFADEPIPTGEVLLVGILQYTSRSDTTVNYLLKLRDAEDCWY